EAADADATDNPRKISRPLDLGAECPHGFGGIQHVLALQQAGHPGLADRKRTQDQGAVRDRLVAGDADGAAQRARNTGFERGRGCGCGQGVSSDVPSRQVTQRHAVVTARDFPTQSAIDSGAATSQVKHRFSDIARTPNVAKSELGTKRICPTTGKKFYDLNKTPVISPYTGEVVTIAPVAPTRMPRGEA